MDPTGQTVVRPRLVVSRCLKGEPCRYNGVPIPGPPFTEAIPWIEIVEVCPELELELGVPRPEIRVILVGGQRYLVQAKTGRDLTQAMIQFANRFLEKLGVVDGFILKARSPSCGVWDTKIMDGPLSNNVVALGPGMFAKMVLSRFPDLPFVDEIKLRDPISRWHFFSAVFALAKLREVSATPSMERLQLFHAQHKYLFMGLDQEGLLMLGKLLANHDRRSESEILGQYILTVRRLLKQLPRKAKLINAFMHVFGYVSDQISAFERSDFLRRLDGFREGQLTIKELTLGLRVLVERCGIPYLKGQALLYPFPDALWG